MSDGAGQSDEDPVSFAARYFDAVAPFYDAVTSDGAEGWTPNLVLAEVLATRLKPGMTALDVGAGTGQTVQVLLGTLSPSDVTAIDVSEGMLDVLRGRMPDVRTFEGTIEAFAATAQARPFNLVTAVGALEFVDDLASFFAASGRLLAPDGLLAFTYVPSIHFHKLLDPAAAGSERGAGQRDSRFPFKREPGEVARLVAMAGLEMDRDIELVAYREGSEPIIYHLVLARRR